MTESTELYYAEMEAARNGAEHEYFKARPKLMGTISERALFKAGYERAFKKLWYQLHPQNTKEQS